MKVIINENDVKGILLKLWEENPYLDPIQMKMFGLSINNVSVLNMFSKFLGDEEIEKRLNDIIKLRTDFEITDCGNYRFKFQITDWSVKGGEIRIKCWVDSENGTMSFIHDENGEERSLDDVLHNDDYGWEIRMEVEDCIGDWINDNIKLSYYTGLLMLIDLDYESGPNVFDL
jgi:hypothetical protein